MSESNCGRGQSQPIIYTAMDVEELRDLIKSEFPETEILEDMPGKDLAVLYDELLNDRNVINKMDE